MQRKGRRPDESERRPLSRPHDGRPAVLHSRAPRHWNRAAGAHATHLARHSVDAAAAQDTTTGGTPRRAARIAVIVIADHSAADDRAENAAENSATVAARRNVRGARIA